MGERSILISAISGSMTMSLVRWSSRFTEWNLVAINFLTMLAKYSAVYNNSLTGAAETSFARNVIGEKWNDLAPPDRL